MGAPSSTLALALQLSSRCYKYCCLKSSNGEPPLHQLKPVRVREAPSCFGMGIGGDEGLGAGRGQLQDSGIQPNPIPASEAMRP